MTKKLRITLVKSPIGQLHLQRKTVKALGLSRLNSSIEQPDNSSVRGMVFKVRHLVKVEELEQ